jgi:hypothetical protein
MSCCSPERQPLVSLVDVWLLELELALVLLRELAWLLLFVFIRPQRTVLQTNNQIPQIPCNECCSKSHCIIGRCEFGPAKRISMI